jgi:uncharacterized protein Veg
MYIRRGKEEAMRVDGGKMMRVIKVELEAIEGREVLMTVNLHQRRKVKESTQMIKS